MVHEVGMDRDQKRNFHGVGSLPFGPQMPRPTNRPMKGYQNAPPVHLLESRPAAILLLPK